MGLFQKRVRVSNSKEPDRFFEGNFWVDSGALYSQVPEDILHHIGIEPQLTRNLILADGRVNRRLLGYCNFRIEGIDETIPCLVVFAPKDSLFLLGVTALENFGVEIDPVNKELKPMLAITGGFLASALPENIKRTSDIKENTMPKRIGVVLTGCGYLDGAEIHEAVVTLLALDRAGVDIVCLAPDRAQMHTVDHITGQPVSGDKRNVLVEAARIARGNVKDIKFVSYKDIDALVIPGGYGAAKNLSDFAVKGADCAVVPEVEKLIVDTNRAGKWIAAICIAPAIVVKALAGVGIKPTVTIGSDKGAAAAIEKMGGKHENRDVFGVCIDEPNKVISTPAYMLGQRISEVAAGIEKAIGELMKRC